MSEIEKHEYMDTDITKVEFGEGYAQIHENSGMGMIGLNSDDVRYIAERLGFKVSP